MRKFGRAAWLAGATVAAWMPAAAWAADDAGEAATDDTTNGTIVVLGQRLEESTPEELEKYGSRLEVVTGDTIDKAGLTDVAQALQQQVPGLYVNPKNGAFDYVDVSLLGSRSSEVLFLVDGVRLSNRLYSSTTPLDTLPAGIVERIEVLKGGQGLYYGTQAVAGIVNVITKGFTRTFDGAVELGYDTNEGYHANGYVRGGSGSHYFVAFASHDEAEGFQPFRTQDYQPSQTQRKRGYNMTTGGLKYAFEPSDAFRLTASYQHNQGRVDYVYAEDRALAFNDRNEEIASLKLDWKPSDRFALYLKGYWHDWDSTFTEFQNVLGANRQPTGALTTIDDHDPWQFEDLGANALAEYRLTDALSLVGGWDYQKYHGQDAVFLIGEHAEEVHAPFAQVKLDTGALSLAAGVRHNMPSDGQDKTVWNVSGRLGLGMRAYLRGQVGTSFRLPDAYELYVIDPCCETGNPNLKPEESFNAEAAIGLGSGPVTGEIAGFYRKVKNLIDIDYSLPAYPDGFIVNTPDAVKFWGGEAVVSARLNDWLHLTADYTHTEAEVVGTSDQVREIPRDNAKLIVDLAAPSGRFGGSAALNWVGDVYSELAGGLGRLNHGNYAVLDLSAWVFLDAAKHHRLGARLENALDNEYATRLVRVRTDVTNVSYAAWNLGTPLTLHVTYRLGF
jgi:outer membrane cobalamin receptor